jgi:hypothetical protein
VEIFSDPIPALFSALMSEPDTQQRWITFTFPVDFYMDPYRPKLEKEIKYWTRKSLFITKHVHVKVAATGTGCCQDLRIKAPFHTRNHIQAIHPIWCNFTEWTLAPHVFNYNENYLQFVTNLKKYTII